MQKEFTKKESKEKLVKLSKGISKAMYVIKIIMIVGMIVCAVSAIICLIGYGLKWPERIYELYPNIKDVTIDYGKEFYNITFKEKVLVGDLYEAGILNKVMLGFSLNCVVGIFQCLILFFVLKLLKPLFDSISNSESPYTYDILKKLKISFVLVTIMVFLESAFLALIVAGILACIYFIYAYGVKMQEDEDMML